MLNIELDQQMVPKSERLPRALLFTLKKAINATVENLPKGTIAVAFVSDEEIHRLNRVYRDKDKVTDVLSFSYIGDEDAETLGDVVISFSQAERQAKTGVRNEIVTLLVHGVLHVLGYDHETKKDAARMLPLQGRIIEHIL